MLRRAADDGEQDFGADAAVFIRRNFYVDDGLKSVGTVPEAIKLIRTVEPFVTRPVSDCTR